MIKNHSLEIDLLRAFSIIIVLITHSLVPFLGSYITNTIWNYLHFSVVAFVLCSGFGNYFSVAHVSNLFSWYKKRLIRLYTPFVLYVLTYAALITVLPSVFRGKDMQNNLPFIVSSLFFYKGADMAWLPLLFIQLTLITPICYWILQNSQRTRGVLLILMLMTGMIVFFPIHSEYSRGIAWIGWGMIYLLGGLLAKNYHNPSYIKTSVLFLGIASVLIHIIYTWILVIRGTALTLIIHKYPPDLYYLSYGMAINPFLTLLFQRFQNFLSKTSVIYTVRFFAKHSYGLLFIHWILLDAVTGVPAFQHPYYAILFSIGLSVGGILLWETLQKKFIFLHRR